MHARKSASAVEFTRIARRNCSISIAGVLAVFGSLMTIVLVAGIVFSLLGAWLVLPFAGIEIAALGRALAWILRHAYDYERIRLTGGVLEIEIADGDRLIRREFNPLWARVVVEGRGSRIRLALRSLGSEFEIGRYLNADDRRGLAATLGKLGVRPARAGGPP